VQYLLSVYLSNPLGGKFVVRYLFSLMPKCGVGCLSVVSQGQSSREALQLLSTLSVALGLTRSRIQQLDVLKCSAVECVGTP
jgi:hypothetical protein